MKVQLIVAHPESNSFNYALHQTAVNTCIANDIQVMESDLYRMDFSAIAGKKDAPNYPTDDIFQLAPAQRWAIKNNDFEASIKVEQTKLENADVLILQFPLWWWSFPAMLKGWIDRVLTSGFAYGENSQLEKKKVMYSITTGGAANDDEREYYQKKIDAREAMLEGYKKHLLKNLL